MTNNNIDDEFLLINKHISKKGEDITEFKETDGKIVIKHFTGLNTDNYILKKQNKKLEFSFFKINGIYYINLNGNHIIDYKKFANGIQQISNLENHVIIRNLYFGEILLSDCDTEIVYKALKIMKDWMKERTSLLKNIWYYIVH